MHQNRQDKLISKLMHKLNNNIPIDSSEATTVRAIALIFTSNSITTTTQTGGQKQN